jgi:formylglycine-generating enzyme required for sulfatase activity
MEFATIGNPNNAADITGTPNPVGSVGYIYNLGKYEVSRDMVTKASTAGGLGITMYDMSSYGGNGVNRPATGISWYEAAKFVNWLNTSNGYQAAYLFDGNGNFQLWSSVRASGSNLFRHKDAYYFLPSNDEWYKGAYGNHNGSWSNFPNGSDSAPMAVASGMDINTAVYNQGFMKGPSDIADSGGLSSYGTIAQGGNIREWTESAVDGANTTADENREIRGGSWQSTDAVLSSSTRESFFPGYADNNFGFRVASVPEPSSLSLLALGGVVVALGRRR